MKRSFIIALLMSVAAASALCAFEKKTVTNADGVKMVKTGPEESTIALTIQASNTAFDTSGDAGATFN